MEFQSITPEEVKRLQFSSRTGKESPWQEILDATDKGPVKVTVEPDKLQSLKWGVSRAAKKAGLKIEVATLADKTGVVLTKVPSAVPPPVSTKPATEPGKK